MSDDIDAMISDWEADAKRLGLTLPEYLRRQAFAARTDGDDEAASGLENLAAKLDDNLKVE